MVFVFQTFGSKENGFKCPLCSRHFTRTRVLNDHLRGQHHLGDPFVCDCGAEFRNRTSMNKHKKKCQVCLVKVVGKTFGIVGN